MQGWFPWRYRAEEAQAHQGVVSAKKVGRDFRWTRSLPRCIPGSKHQCKATTVDISAQQLPKDRVDKLLAVRPTAPFGTSELSIFYLPFLCPPTLFCPSSL
jgi:hypothetical protein